MEFYARLAVEYFLASGDRTKERLDELLEHFATTHGLTVDKVTREQAYTKARVK